MEFVALVLSGTPRGEAKGKRLHEGGVGPAMLLPAGLTSNSIGAIDGYVKMVLAAKQFWIQAI